MFSSKFLLPAKEIFKSGGYVMKCVTFTLILAVQLTLSRLYCSFTCYFLQDYFLHCSSASSLGDIKIKQEVQQVLTSQSFGFWSISISKTGCKSPTSWGNNRRKSLYPLTCNMKFQNLVSHLSTSSIEEKEQALWGVNIS